MLSPEQQSQIDEWLRGGNKIAAIKAYREWTRLDLKESKDAIEARCTELGLETFAGPKNKGGCLGLLLALATPLAASALYFSGLC